MDVTAVGQTGSVGSRRLQISLTAIGSCAIVLVFLPFTYGVVPFTDVLLDVSLDALWFLALPAILLPVPITIGYALWLAGRMPAWSGAAGWLLSGLAAACLLASLLDTDRPDLVVLLPSAACYAGGAWLGRAFEPAGGPPGSLLAMQSAYLGHMGIFLGSFLGEGDIGVALAGTATLAYLLQFAVAVRRRRAWLAVAWLPPIAVVVLSVIYPG